MLPAGLERLDDLAEDYIERKCKCIAPSDYCFQRSRGICYYLLSEYEYIKNSRMSIIDKTPPEKTAVILIGLPASGKSSFFAAFYEGKYTHINLDTLRTRKKRRRCWPNAS